MLSFHDDFSYVGLLRIVLGNSFRAWKVNEFSKFLSIKILYNTLNELREKFFSTFNKKAYGCKSQRTDHDDESISKIELKNFNITLC